MHIKSINFKSARPYSFTTDVNGQRIKLHVRYNSYSDTYYLNVDRFINGQYENIINGIPLVTGIDLFLQYPQFNLGELMIIPFKPEYYDKIPNAETIVNNFQILWGSES